MSYIVCLMRWEELYAHMWGYRKNCPVSQCVNADLPHSLRWGAAIWIWNFQELGDLLACFFFFYCVQSKHHKIREMNRYYTLIPSWGQVAATWLEKKLERGQACSVLFRKNHETSNLPNNNCTATCHPSLKPLWKMSKRCWILLEK